MTVKDSTFSEWFRGISQLCSARPVLVQQLSWRIS